MRPKPMRMTAPEREPYGRDDAAWPMRSRPVSEQFCHAREDRAHRDVDREEPERGQRASDDQKADRQNHCPDDGHHRGRCARCQPRKNAPRGARAAKRAADHLVNATSTAAVSNASAHSGGLIVTRRFGRSRGRSAPGSDGTAIRSSTDRASARDAADRAGHRLRLRDGAVLRARCSPLRRRYPNRSFSAWISASVGACRRRSTRREPIQRSES